MIKDIEALKARIAEMEGENAKLEAMISRVFNRPGCCVMLDGRNEHGSHVIMSLPSYMPASAEDDINEAAEYILETAEANGYEIGTHVWTLWDWNKPQIGFEGRVELPGYWEFSGIDPDLTDVLARTAGIKTEAGE